MDVDEECRAVSNGGPSKQWDALLSPGGVDPVKKGQLLKKALPRKRCQGKRHSRIFPATKDIRDKVNFEWQAEKSATTGVAGPLRLRRPVANEPEPRPVKRPRTNMTDDARVG